MIKQQIYINSQKIKKTITNNPNKKKIVLILKIYRRKLMNNKQKLIRIHLN